MIEFDIQESFDLFGFYQSNNFTFPVTMKVIEEDVATELIAQQLYRMVNIHQGFDLADAKEGKDGTMLADSADYTAPHIIARFILRQAEAAHAAITQNIRQHFMEITNNAEPLMWHTHKTENPEIQKAVAIDCTTLAEIKQKCTSLSELLNYYSITDLLLQFQSTQHSPRIFV